MFIYDISNPTSIPNPVQLTTGASGSGIADIYAQGRYVYLADSGATAKAFEIIDMANPAAPTIVGSVSSASITGAVTSLAVLGSYAYVGNSTGTVFAVDVKDPTTPAVSNSVALGGNAQSLTTQSRTLYVADNSSNLIRSVNITTPGTPIAISGTSATQGAVGAQVLTAVGRYIYLGTGGMGSNTFQVFDMGGTYSQQLEAGGIETDTLSTRGNANFASDAAVQGSLAVGTGLQVSGNSSFTSNSTTSTALQVTANSLSTGTALTVGSSSASLSSGGLLSVSQTSTYTSATPTYSGNTANVSRSLSAGLANPDVAFDSYNANTDSSSIALTVGNNPNRFLIVKPHCQWSGTDFTPLSATWTVGATVQSMTLSEKIFILVAPTVGSGTFDVVCPIWTSRNITISSWYNVDQSTPIRTSTSAFYGTGAAISTVINSVNAADIIVDYLTSPNGVGPYTPFGGGQITLGNTVYAPAASIQNSSYKVAGATSATMSWTSGTGSTTHRLYALKKPEPVALTVTGSALSVSSNCTAPSGGNTCTDSGNVLNLQQSYGSASGAVLALQNAGSGAAIALTQTGSSTIDIQLAKGNIQTANGTTSSAVSISSGNASAGVSGTVGIDNGTFTSGTPTINLGVTNSRAINIGNASATTALTLQGGTGSSAISIQSGAAGTINVATANAANTVQVGNTANAISQTLNIGNNNTPSSSTTINLGSSKGTSLTTIQGGSSGVAIKTASGYSTIGNLTGTEKVAIGEYYSTYVGFEFTSARSVPGTGTDGLIRLYVGGQDHLKTDDNLEIRTAKDSDSAFSVRQADNTKLIEVATAAADPNSATKISLNAESVFANTANVSFAPQTVTVSAASDTLTPTSSFVLLQCNRAAAADTAISISETGARAGQLLIIVIDGVTNNAGTCSWADIGGQQQVGTTTAFDDFGSKTFMYDGAQWVQTAESIN